MTEMQTKINRLKAEVRENLQHNILPYWMKLVDLGNGGFIGQVKGDETIQCSADKGAVLNARILWSFFGSLPGAEGSNPL